MLFVWIGIGVRGFMCGRGVGCVSVVEVFGFLECVRVLVCLFV